MAEPWPGTTSGGENRPRPLRALAGWPLRLAARFFASRTEALGLRRIPDRGPAVLLVSGETSAVSLLLVLALLRRPAQFVARLRQSRGRLRSSLVRALGGIPLGVGTDPGVRARNEEGLRTLEHELVSGGLVVFFMGRNGDEGHAETALEAIRRASGRGSAPVTLPVAVTCDAFRLFRRPAELIVGIPLSPEALSAVPQGGERRPPPRGLGRDRREPALVAGAGGSGGAPGGAGRGDLARRRARGGRAGGVACPLPEGQAGAPAGREAPSRRRRRLSGRP